MFITTLFNLGDKITKYLLFTDHSKHQNLFVGSAKKYKKVTDDAQCLGLTLSDFSY